MKRKHSLCAALALTLALGAALTGCGSASSPSGSADSSAAAADNAAAATDLKWNIEIPAKDGSLCGAPIYIAQENGYFEEEGIGVNFTTADFETKKIGINNGTYPIVNGDFQYFPAIDEGVKIRIVGGLHEGCIKFMVRPDSDISSPEDLVGKTIGVDEIGGTPYQVASLWLEQAGISAKDSDGQVKFVPYTDGNLELQALYDGDIDVAAMWDPLGPTAAKQGKAKVIFDLSTAENFADKYCCFLYASDKVLNEDPDLIAALLRAYAKAQDFIANNPEESVTIIKDGKYSQIEDDELAAELLESYHYPTLGSEDHVAADIKYFGDELYKIGYVKENGQAFLDTVYAEVEK